MVRQASIQTVKVGEMASFHNNGADVHYEVSGDGPPLLLIAGTGSDGASWGPLVPLLGGRTLILIDNRGSGQTRVQGPLEISEMADDCAALVRHLGLGAVDVVGHSLGGYIGLLFAEAHPEQVRNLVTMGTAPFGPKERVLFRDLARLYFTLPPDDWFRLFYQWLFSVSFFADETNVAAAAAASTAYPYRQSPGDFARQMAGIERAGPVDLSRITCAVMAMSAELDLLAPPAAVKAMHTPIPHVHHILVTGAAHSIHWEKPAEVARAILEFLGAPETVQ
jgi:aminoacrylate hydrolase